MESTYIRPWLVASVRDRTAIGSCTLVITCQVFDPTERAASTVSGETPRIPSAMILIDTGAAYTIAATMPVNRDAENNARNGTRQTNDGMVCAASRNGRTNVSTVELRPIHTPTTTPSATTMTVATSTAARVSIVACHSSSGQRIRPRHTAVMSADQRPPTIAAIAV